jgi:hypothetical protein
VKATGQQRILCGFEAITPNSDGLHTDWKSFQHYKRVLGESPPACGQRLSFWNVDTNHKYSSEVADPMMGQDDTSTPNGGPVLYGQPGVWDSNPSLGPMYVEEASGDFVPLPANLDELKQMSLNAMLPLVKAELSLVNSVIELKDFKSLPRTISNIKALASRLIKIKANMRKTLKQITKSSADGYLQAQFNILPLLSDISGIHAALSRHERRVNDLVTRAGRPQNKHFAYKWQELPASTEDGVKSGTCRFRYQKYPVMNNFTYTFTSRIRRWSYSEPTIFHAQIQYNYNYTEYQREHARVLALLDSLGVNFNPAIIWNAIPWSFVVDWVFGVSRWLNQFTIAHMEPQINIRRYLWSVKRVRRIVVEHTMPDTSLPGSPLNPWVPYPIVNESAYRRVVGLPSMSSIISSGLSSKEVSLGAALVVARKRR